MTKPQSRECCDLQLLRHSAVFLIVVGPNVSSLILIVPTPVPFSFTSVVDHKAVAVFSKRDNQFYIDYSPKQIAFLL